MAAEVSPSGQDGDDQETTIHEPSDYDYQPTLDEGQGRVFSRLQRIEHRSGPMPDGAEMMRYKQVDDSLPGSIVAMAQDEQRHRHAMEKLALEGSLKETRLGQVLGFSIAAFVLILSGVMALAGHPVLAGILAGIDVVGLAAVFLGTHYVQRTANSGGEQPEQEDPPVS